MLSTDLQLSDSLQPGAAGVNLADTSVLLALQLLTRCVKAARSRAARASTALVHSKLSVALHSQMSKLHTKLILPAF